MVATRMSLTGGLGSRHHDEAFGDPFELPPDQAYNETCASIASVMLAWRLLLATGEEDCADVLERTILNGVLSGLALDGTAFFYVNPLQRRTHRAAGTSSPGERGGSRRESWFACACCPPNLMRTLSSWEGYLATSDASGIQIQQYATADIDAVVAGGGPVRLHVETAYPWDGHVVITVLETPDTSWTLGLRVPGWCRSATLSIGSDVRAVADGTRLAMERRAWHAGDQVVLELDMPVRISAPHPRADALRGTLAIERGPLVYCIETADLPAGVELEELEIEPTVQPVAVPRNDVTPGLVGLRLEAFRRSPDGAREDGGPVIVGAIPYFAWANRGVGAMRVWIPRRGV